MVLDEQKDHLYYNPERGSIFFVTLGRYGRRWKLLEYITFTNLLPHLFVEKLNYCMIVLMSHHRDRKHSYIIDNDTISREKLNRKYWGSLLHSSKISESHCRPESPVSKSRVEQEIRKSRLKVE